MLFLLHSQVCMAMMKTPQCPGTLLYLQLQPEGSSAISQGTSHTGGCCCGNHKVPGSHRQRVPNCTELINIGRWLHPLVPQLHQTAPAGHNSGWKSQQLQENWERQLSWEHSYDQRVFECLTCQMERTLGYPRKPLLVIFLLIATSLLFICE